MPELKTLTIAGVTCTLMDTAARASIASMLTRISSLEAVLENKNSVDEPALRDSELVFSETTPSDEGQITWLCI